MTKYSVPYTPYLRSDTSYDCHFLVHMCDMISPGMCSIFSKFWFLSKSERNGPKIVLCTPYLRDLTSYDHPFMILLCKIIQYNILKSIISSVVFYFFKILIFWVVRGQRAKKDPKLPMTEPSCSIPQEW